MAKESNRNRRIIAFPDLEGFYNQLMDRLQMLTLEFFHSEKPFTIFINCIARNHTSGTMKEVERLENFHLVYGGIQTQKKFLEKGHAPTAILALARNPLKNNCMFFLVISR